MPQTTKQLIAEDAVENVNLIVQVILGCFQPKSVLRMHIHVAILDLPNQIVTLPLYSVTLSSYMVWIFCR